MRLSFNDIYLLDICYILYVLYMFFPYMYIYYNLFNIKTKRNWLRNHRIDGNYKETT